mgnify:CR=1 FL=1
MRFILHQEQIGKAMSGLLPGGVTPHHRLNDDKKDHYSQLLLKRCLHDRNPLLIKMEDKYRAREIVEEKKSGNLPELYHWSDKTHKIPWDKLPSRCVIKTNHWSGDALFIMDNDEERRCRMKEIASFDKDTLLNEAVWGLGPVNLKVVA